MKLKLDFITNSSTTCFVVMGDTVNIKNISKEILEEKGKQGKYVDIDDDAWGAIESLLEESDLDYTFGEEYSPSDELYVGIPFTAMQDDETLKEFKNRVTLQALECLGVQVTPGYIEMAWRDG